MLSRKSGSSSTTRAERVRHGFYPAVGREVELDPVARGLGDEVARIARSVGALHQIAVGARARRRAGRRPGSTTSTPSRRASRACAARCAARAAPRSRRRSGMRTSRKITRGPERARRVRRAPVTCRAASASRPSRAVRTSTGRSSAPQRAQRDGDVVAAVVDEEEERARCSSVGLRPAARGRSARRARARPPPRRVPP